MDDITKIRYGELPKDSPYVKPIRFYYCQNNVEKNWDLLMSPDSVVIIIYHKIRMTLILVKQFRPAIYYSVIGRLGDPHNIDMKKYPPSLGISLELCGGLIDKPSLSIEEIASEEILEECGYNVPVDRLEKVLTYRCSVGTNGSLETLFYCEVTDDDKKRGCGGGVGHELIEVVEYTIEQTRNLLQQIPVVQSPSSFLFGIQWFLCNKCPMDSGTTLNTNFKFCTDLTKPEDVDGFFEFLDDVYGNLAMVNYPYETNFLTPLPPYPVREFCKKLASQYNDTALITALQSAISVYTNYTGKLKCLNTTSAYDESMGIKAWEIQTCTEMVMPMCTNGQEDMFPAEKWNFEKYSENCFKKYGLRPNPYQAITTYGGKHLKDASNIIFSNGLLDPWCGGGVLRSPNQNIKVIIIPDSAHHLDLRASNINDPGSVIQARIMELEQIKTWIKQL